MGSLRAADFGDGGRRRARSDRGYRFARRAANRRRPSREWVGDKTDQRMRRELERCPRLLRSVLRRYRVKQPVHGIAHITGGGLEENLARIVPEKVRVVIDRGSWKVPAVFPWVQKLGSIEDAEMARVFNMGVGMVLVVSPHFADSIVSQLSDAGVEAWRIGAVEAAEASDARVVIR